jgi:hypothetical protein
MPLPVSEDEIVQAKKTTEAEFEQNQQDSCGWLSYFQIWSRSLRPSRGRAKPKPDIIDTEAHLEHLWPDGSAAVSVKHERIGWLEFDIAKGALPEGAEPGCYIPVTLYLGRNGTVLRHQIRPVVVVLPVVAKRSSGPQLGSRLPKPPKDWSDAADVARYDRELEEWEAQSSFRKPQAGA